MLKCSLPILVHEAERIMLLTKDNILIFEKWGEVSVTVYLGSHKI